ncbi:hypothetical protein E1A91_A09G077600v1 [Gossypium mustelinum]|uniref:Uncharacterized protein n=1 Tax=Gossypium mustelinum TaxID=34275 RepID=A0A5D2XUN9_GOSMU|nr:hypothetical protein E1A91_A09G077600v1 [Gossypium mustelinum]
MAFQRRSMMPLDPSNFDFQRRGQRSMANLQDLAVQRRRVKEAARGATRGSPNFWPILARSRSS